MRREDGGVDRGEANLGIVRKMQYFRHVWDFVLVDFLGPSMTHGFYCVLSTVWGGADAGSCTPGWACQPGACGDTIFRKMITEIAWCRLKNFSN